MGVFHSLMERLARDDANPGVSWSPIYATSPVVEQLILTRHEEGARTAIFTANFTPRAGGPGVNSPERARSAVPPRERSAGRCSGRP